VHDHLGVVDHQTHPAALHQDYYGEASRHLRMPSVLQKRREMDHRNEATLESGDSAHGGIHGWHGMDLSDLRHFEYVREL
jgi:hypothetical protein